MIIGFDAKRATHNKTGLGNYSRFIIRLLATDTQDNKLILYSPKKRKELLPKKLSNIEIATPKSWIWKKLSSIWRVWSITNQIKKDEPQIYHGLSNELPLNIRKAKKTKSIVTIHDLIFLRYPKYYKPIDRKIYEYKFRKACENSDKIIAVSECTKRDIIDFFNIDSKKIEVVYQGCDNAFREEANAELLVKISEKYRLPKHFFLYVGSIEERKNLLTAVKALKYLPEEVNIVAIGKHTEYTKKIKKYIKKLEIGHRVKLLHSIPFSELTSFYKLAHAFIYPSFYEGFGIPVLEALCSKLPVIAAKGSCLEEAGGKHSLYVDPRDEEEMAKAMQIVWSEDDVRERMIAEGLKHADRFKDEPIREQLKKIYYEIISS